VELCWKSKCYKSNHPSNSRYNHTHTNTPINMQEICHHCFGWLPERRFVVGYLGAERTFVNRWWTISRAARERGGECRNWRSIKR